MAVQGFVSTPGVLLNSVLGLLPERTTPVLSAESLTVVVPMYNEEQGARRCLASLLRQEDQPEQIAISINGGRDNTYAVVSRILGEYGFRLEAVDSLPELDATLERWLGGTGTASVAVVRYRSRTAKSESINNLIRYRLVSSDRVLLVDGDTILHPGFISSMRHNFYRLRRERTAGGHRFVIEDYALSSGSVTSWAPAKAPLWQRMISAGRRAEYAFSALQRRGQARQLGRSAVFGNTRLFTVVGCGFSARRELFPMPGSTRTEDHEFTLEIQNLRMSEQELTPEALDSLGLNIVTAAGAVQPSAYFGSEEQVILRTGGNARFVPEALMMTQDPSTVNGFLNQVERWNGGGIEGALGRIGRKLRPNVSWTVWLAQFENLLGIILMLFLLPNLVALNLGNPSLGMSGRALALWLLLNVTLSLLLNFAGFRAQRLAGGIPPGRALTDALRLSLLTLPAYLLIRFLSPFTYVAAALEIVPGWFRNRRTRKRSAIRGVSWERPVAGRLSLRTQWVMVSVLAVYPLLTGFVVAPVVNPVNAAGWQLTHTGRQLQLDDYIGPGPLQPYQAAAEPEVVYCSADDPAAVQLTIAHAGEWAYEPLGLWDLLALGRLSPLLPTIEAASDSYGLQVRDVLKVFMNESLFDPLAQGPTGDLGLSQLTGDALTLLAGASTDPRSVIYNPRLISEHSNVFDPVFSACAGAAKLAWAFDQPKVSSLQEAYALYINPVHAFANGRIGERWLPLVAQMESLEPNIMRIAAVYAQYLSGPESLTSHERALVQISFDVAEGRLGLGAAYAQALEVINAAQIDDLDVYRRVLSRLYGFSVAGG